jgi:RNA polymerase sigma-70 factor (ECF subfamily)
MPTRDHAELLKTASLHPESVSDDELMLLLRESPSRADYDFLFAEFHRRFHPRVQAWCLRLSRSRSRAADLAQEVFLKAWRHMDSFRGDSRPSTWLYVIARNHCLSAAQRLVSDPLNSGAPLSPRLWDSALPHPDSHIARYQLSRDVCHLMNAALDPMEARVLALHYGYDVSLAAITTRMALDNPSGAKAYIVNGRRKIKHALERRKSLALDAHRVEVNSDTVQRELVQRKIA